MRRFTLLASSVVAVIVLGALAVWSQVDASSKVGAVHRDDRVQLQSTLAGLTQQYLSFTFLSTKSAADDTPWVLTPNNATDRRALSAIVRTSPLTSYGAALVSLTGRPITAYPSTAALPSANDPGFAAMRLDLLSGQPGLSDVMHVGDVPVVAFAVPITAGGHYIGLLVTFADLRTWPLQGYDAQMHIGAGSQSIVTDRQGYLVAATDPAQIGHRLSDVPHVIVGGRTGFTAFDAHSGARMVASYGPAGHGWTAATVQPAASFSGVIDRSHHRELLALAALLSLVVLLLVVFHHKRQQVLGRLADERLYDPLTGIGQRGVFMMRMDAALARLRRHHRPLGVLYCDVDGFKGVNDRHGHNVGDQVLTAVAQRMCAAVRDTDMVARLGGDEFAVVIEETSVEEVQRIAERVRRSVSEPIVVNGRSLTPRISVGGAVVDGHDGTTDELMHAADLAMYQAKSSGTGCLVVDVNATPVSVATVPSPREARGAELPRH